MFDSCIETKREKASDGTYLPGYMRTTERLKQFKRTKFFEENHPLNS